MILKQAQAQLLYVFVNEQSSSISIDETISCVYNV